jgi:predicted nucleotidyltransferase
VKAFYLPREGLLARLREVSSEALQQFPELLEVRLFGSLARGEETGLSDVDLFLVVVSDEKDPLERMKPYYHFFAGKLALALDMIVATREELDNHGEALKGSVIISHRNQGLPR